MRGAPYRFIAAMLCATVLAGCASPLATLGSVAKVALEVSGITKPELPELQKPPRKVPVSIATGKNLNAGDSGRPLSAVMRIYKLKDTTAFYQAPFDAFVTAGRDKTALGDDLIESREITLIPDQQLNLSETLPRTVNAMGIVVLFHSPGGQRWRVAFDAAEAEKTGVVIGAHACALTVTQGAVLDMQGHGQSEPPRNYNRLAQVNCRT
ncbi:type VI secretion system lipoprotein TssJ [Variovorax robiniae]|uniref:Type VI secretion system lipoprotein TssJ n=1 Tax=Variovorax robiniae TaxID=1836199 RepID=A0ABU8XC68_9BURK